MVRATLKEILLEDKEVLNINMKEKSLISQKHVYDKLNSDDVNASNFQITAALGKNCILAQHYKQDLQIPKAEKVI